MTMLPSRPYLIRAIYEWISDNGLTPYLLVNVQVPGCQIPEQHVNEGKIILNIRDEAVQDLQLGNEWVTFNARVSGVPMEVNIPIQAVLAIYARENGQGMGWDEVNEDNDSDAPHASTKKKPRKPHLTIVK